MRFVSHAVVRDRGGVGGELYRSKRVVALSDRRLYGIALEPCGRISAREHTGAFGHFDAGLGTETELFGIHIHRRDADASADLGKVTVTGMCHRALELLVTVYAQTMDDVILIIIVLAVTVDGGIGGDDALLQRGCGYAGLEGRARRERAFKGTVEHRDIFISEQIL